MNILITGASGFIGSFIVEQALHRGMNVWAGMRKTSSRRYLKDARIHFIELDLNDLETLISQLQGHCFDYVVHAAGVTKSLNKDDFYRTNAVGTHNLAMALVRTGMPLRRFVFLSSLSVMGAVREKRPYSEIKNSDTPQPNTAYGRSKLKGEQLLASIKELPYIILRPTGVYGPREKDYFLMAKSICSHIDFSVGYKPQDITFVYVSDVVDAVFLALEHGKIGASYFLSDGNVYSSRTFSDLIISEMGNLWCLRIKAPIWILHIVTFIGEYISKISGKISALNNDKYNILRQRNWRCDIEPSCKELGYKPQIDLASGVHFAMKWYKNEGWL